MARAIGQALAEGFEADVTVTGSDGSELVTVSYDATTRAESGTANHDENSARRNVREACVRNSKRSMKADRRSIGTNCLNGGNRLSETALIYDLETSSSPETVRLRRLTPTKE